MNYRNLEQVKEAAKLAARRSGDRFTVILLNPGPNEEFTDYSTYEYVTDSYFENEHTAEHIVICNTDELNVKKHQIFDFTLRNQIPSSIMAKNNTDRISFCIKHNIDYEKEIELIKKKKSKLSSSIRKQLLKF